MQLVLFTFYHQVLQVLGSSVRPESKCLSFRSRIPISEGLSYGCLKVETVNKPLVYWKWAQGEGKWWS